MVSCLMMCARATASSDWLTRSPMYASATWPHRLCIEPTQSARLARYCALSRRTAAVILPKRSISHDSDAPSE